MKKLLLILTFVLTACGNDYTYIQDSVTSEFNGIFYVTGSDNNCIELTQNFDGLVDIATSCQKLVTVNPENDTLGEFPNISLRDQKIIDGKVRFTVYQNFTSDLDVEEDVSGSNISGRKKVEGVLEFVEGSLRLELRVFDDDTNLNFVVAERVFEEVE